MLRHLSTPDNTELTLLPSAAMQPLVGKLYTQFSLKWTFILFFAIFELGSLICGVAPSSKALIVGRAVAGLGVSGVFAGALTIIAAALAPEKRASKYSLDVNLQYIASINRIF